MDEKEGMTKEEQLALVMRLLEKEPHRFAQLEGIIQSFARQRTKQNAEACALVPTLQMHDEHWWVHGWWRGWQRVAQMHGSLNLATCFIVPPRGLHARQPPAGFHACG